MAALNEGRHTAEFLVSEANGNRSRDVVTIANGAAYEPGTVLGQVTASGKYKPHAAGASDGTQNAAAVLYDAADASEGDADAVIIARDAEVALGAISFASGISQANKATAIAALADNGIVAR